MEKTNVMRLLDQKKADYTAHSYASTGAISGVDVAAALGQDPARVFKTLVTVGKTGQHYVFVIPVAKEATFTPSSTACPMAFLSLLHEKFFFT